MKVLPRKFYINDTIQVAKDLLGKELVRKIGRQVLSGIITETEAYRGKDDPASHAAIKMTNRNKVMFGHAGMSYVYFTYGMYFMLNVVAKSKRQDAGAVLIRGIFPQEGIKTMIRNRGIKDLSKITNGPAKITMAMNISMKENNVDMTKNSTIYISDGIPIKKIKKSPRVGISKAVEKEWNFSINPKNYF